MNGIQHLVQDLRASAHRCPEDLRPLIRRAAAELEQLTAFDEGAMVRSCPFPPPEMEEAHALDR
jgi:hypothetical protein